MNKSQKFYRRIGRVPANFSYLLSRLQYIKNLPQLTPFDKSIVDTLSREGVCITSLEELTLTSTPKLLNSSLKKLSEIKNNGCTNLTQVATLNNYPDIFLWGLEQRLLNIVEAYIGLPVKYHGVNLFRNLATNEPRGPQFWHRDGEDRRIVKIIIYLNDVEENNGPFEYIPRRFTPSLLSFTKSFGKLIKNGFSAMTDEDMNKIVPKSSWKQCLGAKGTVVFVDTRTVFHHGKVPKAERAALFFVYTSRNPVRPDICGANFDFDRTQLLELAQQLPHYQQEYIHALCSVHE